MSTLDTFSASIFFLIVCFLSLDSIYLMNKNS